MVELFAGYSVAQIIIFIIVIALALKEGVSIFEFFYSRSKTHFQDEFEGEQEIDIMKKDIEALYEGLEKTNAKFDDITNALGDIKDICNRQQNTLNKLIESDRDDIKGFIVEKYHYFTEHKGWIDDFSMDVLEKRFAHYVAEGGNSYVESLMDELRKLPKCPPQDK